MKNNKIILIIGGALILIILVVAFNFKAMNNLKSNASPANSDINLNKYRSEEIPEDCRLPEYENDIHWWKEHLSHHKQTWYCLDYYKEVE